MMETSKEKQLRQRDQSCDQMLTDKGKHDICETHNKLSSADDEWLPVKAHSDHMET